MTIVQCKKDGKLVSNTMGTAYIVRNETLSEMKTVNDVKIRRQWYSLL